MGLGARADRALFNAFFKMVPLEDAVDKDAWDVDAVGIQGPGRDQLLDFRDRDPAGHGHHGVEISGRALENEVARFVAFPGLDKGELRVEGVLQNVGLAVEDAHLFAFGDLRAVAGRGVEGGDAGACSAAALGEGALGDEFDLELAGEHLAFEFVVFAHVGANHFAHLARFQKEAQAKAVHACVVGDAGEAGCPGGAHGGDGVFGNATEAKSAEHDRHAVRDTVHSGLSVGDYLFNHA